jgi:hypothetical protein
MDIDGYFRVSMGILQKLNYGSPKSRNVRSEAEGRPVQRKPVALSLDLSRHQDGRGLSALLNIPT